MQIHDHLALGKALAEAYFADRGALCRLAFVLGNIAPDLTATTHLRGHLHDRNTWGHSYANALPVFKRGRTFYIEVINPVQYASYVEFGHRTPGGKGWVAGRYFLTISEQKLEQVAPSVIEKKLEALLREAFKV